VRQCVRLLHHHSKCVRKVRWRVRARGLSEKDAREGCAGSCRVFGNRARYTRWLPTARNARAHARGELTRCRASDVVDVPRRHLARTCSLVAGTEWLRCFGISPITTAAAGDVFVFSDDCRVPRPPPMVNQLSGHVPARGNEFDVRRDPTRRRQRWCHCGTLHKRIPLFGHDVPKNHRSLTSYHVVLTDGVHHRCIIKQLWCSQVYNYYTT